MRIRLATNGDCALLPDIEFSAARRYGDIGMPDVASVAPVPAAAWEPHCENSTLWVSVDDQDRPFGFLASGAQAEGFLFVYELAVAYAHQRQGAGRALLEAAEAGARSLGLKYVYLTTFRDVPFNAPYYARLGYETVADDALPAALAPVMDAERSRWPEADRRRCAMRKRV